MQYLYPAMAALARWCERHSDDSGLLYDLSNLNSMQADIRGAKFETNVLYYQTLHDLSRSAVDLEQPTDAARWKAEAERVKASLRQLYWNPQKDLYVDSVFEGRQSTTITEVANGMALLYGVATKEQVPRIVRRLAEPPPDLVLSSAPYFYYVKEGLIRVGAIDTALKVMRDRRPAIFAASDTGAEANMKRKCCQWT